MRTGERARRRLHVAGKRSLALAGAGHGLTMKIAFVSTGTLSTFGSTYRVLGLARQLCQQGLDVHVLLPGLPDNRARFPDRCYHGAAIHFSECGAWSEMRSKYEILKSIRPDVVHCIDVVKRCFLPSAAYRCRNACRLVVDIDEKLSVVYRFPKNLYAYVAERTAFWYADDMIAASRFLETEVAAYRSTRILYLPYASDLEFFIQNRQGWEATRQRWPGRRIVTYFGSLYPRYDAGLVFDVAVKILRKRRDTVFLFMGTGPLLEGLRAKTAELGLNEFMHWLGFVPDEDVPKYLTASDCLVFPIRDNRMNRARGPSKTYHYIAAMVPIVTNPVGEVCEALGERAWYFKDGDANDFEEVLEQCLDAPESEQRRPDPEMAERHSWRQRADVYLRYLQQSGSS